MFSLSCTHIHTHTAASTTNVALSTTVTTATAFGSSKVPDLSISQLSNTLNASVELKAAPNMAQPRTQEPYANTALVSHPQSLTHPQSTLTSTTPHLQPTLHHSAPFLTSPIVQYSPAIPPNGPGVIYAQVSPLTYTDNEQMPVFPKDHNTTSLFSKGSQLRVNHPGLPRHNLNLAPKASTTEVSPLDVVLSKSSLRSNCCSPPLTAASLQHQPGSRSITPQGLLAENKTLTGTTASPYAPSPPPLNIALQVPTFHMSSTEGIGTNTYPSYPPKPQFNTASLLSSLKTRESSATQSASSSITPSQVSISKPISLPAADLSLLSTTQEMDTVTLPGSTNFLNIEASVEQMSTLAKSVLEDMEHQHQHTRLTNIKPPLQHLPSTLPSTHAHLNVPTTATLPSTHAHLSVPTTATLPSTHTHLNVPTTATLPSTHAHLNVPATATLPSTHAHLNVPTTATLPSTRTHLNVPTTATLPSTHAHLNVPTTATLPSTHAHLNVPTTATLPSTHAHLNVPTTATLHSTHTHLNVPATPTLPNTPGPWMLPSGQMLPTSNQLERTKVLSH